MKTTQSRVNAIAGKDNMTDHEKQLNCKELQVTSYKATDKKILEDRIMNLFIAKTEAEWWAQREIERLRNSLKQKRVDKEKEEPKEPIYYDCTLAKFAEQLDIPLWKAMAFGKYFSGQKRVLDFDKVYDILDATIYRQFEMNNKQMLDDDIRKLAKKLTDPYGDIYKDKLYKE